MLYPLSYKGGWGNHTTRRPAYQQERAGGGSVSGVVPVGPRNSVGESGE